MKGLLVASLVACAREGLVKVDVVAGDGTKVKANASVAVERHRRSSWTTQIAELETLIDAEVDGWLAQARRRGRGRGRLFGGDDDGPGRAAGPGRWRAIAGRLVRRQQARAVLAAQDEAARQAGRGRGARSGPPGWSARADRPGPAARREEAGCGPGSPAASAAPRRRPRPGPRKRPDGRVPVAARGQRGGPPGSPGRGKARAGSRPGPPPPAAAPRRPPTRRTPPTRPAGSCPARTAATTQLL